MTKKFLLIVFVFFGTVLKAQVPKDQVSVDVNVFPKETVALSINSEVLLAGELLQYKAYIFNASNKISALSKMVYVSLRKQNDSVVFNHKLRVENGTANGDFFIPSNLNTGIYKLIGYTNFSKNNAQNGFVQKDIYIINTFVKRDLDNRKKDTIAITASNGKDFNISEIHGNSEMLKTTLNKQTYGFREKVNLKLESHFKNTDGNYVLSVRKINPVEISGKIPIVTKAISSEIFYVPELRGELISGIVLSISDNVPLANIEVSLTIPDEDFVLKTSKTNSEGRFFFSVSEAYNAENSVVQIYGDAAERSANKVILDKKDFSLNKNKPYFLNISSDLKDWLQERSVQVQVENAYYDIKKDSILPKWINPAFYSNLGTVFNLDDYTRFPSIKETFVEVVTLAAIRGTGDNAKFIVNNEYDPNGTAKFNDIPPLVLLDGIQIVDSKELVNFSTKEIQKVRVIIEPYRYGPKIYSGIIAVETKKGDFIPNEIIKNNSEVSLSSAVKPKESYKPAYDKKSELSKIPDYRVQLLWQPKINFSDLDYNTSFYTSDVPGIFEVKIEGFTEDGTYISEKNYFTVAKN
ncbi:carboxypeptidase regulatory-like domain-containing protein [Aequorivita lipolytica]|uniref:Carboxypeptidase regulatory-like domain-containing protein n=2 Tax=Aequorivita lipolytica TaxID=153267 RepID=A0A5C6YM97_9FLAO|nr:carboxypeptidase regulatory-like domain-containing protein [Aequorivita lipolytica]